MNFYDKYAEKYFSDTIDLNMNTHYDEFTNIIPGRKILDVGCGSGRDSKYFLDNGFEVASIDISEELSKVAKRELNIDVILKSVLDISYNAEFDGIWCSASLLHIMPWDIKEALTKLFKSLKAGGTIYITLKDGKNEIVEEDGRTYVMYDRNFITNLMSSIGFNIINVYDSDDSLNRNGIVWFNIIATKVIK